MSASAEIPPRAKLQARAVVALASASDRTPELARLVASARIKLAAAILAMDDVPEKPGRHDIVEQAEVEAALRGYGHALANLIRGQRDSSDELMIGRTPDTNVDTSVLPLPAFLEMAQFVADHPTMMSSAVFVETIRDLIDRLRTQAP